MNMTPPPVVNNLSLQAVRTRPSGLKTPANPLRAEERRGVSRGEPPDSRPGVHARVVLGPLIGLSSFLRSLYHKPVILLRASRTQPATLLCS